MSIQDVPAPSAAAPVEPVERRDTFRSGREVLATCSVRPQGTAWARVAVVHGYGEHCGRHGPFMRHCAARGVACHAFDSRGHGLSSGRRGFVREWDQYVEDLRAFLALPQLEGEGPLFVVAHSHGALVTAAGVQRGVVKARGVVLSNPYLRSSVPVSVSKEVLARCANHLAPALCVNSGVRAEWLTSDPAMVKENREDALGLRIATPRWWVTVRQAQREVMQRAERFALPLLMLEGTADVVSDPRAMEEFYERVGSREKKIVRYERMLHELLRETGRVRVYEDVLAWMRERTT